MEFLSPEMHCCFRKSAKDKIQDSTLSVILLPAHPASFVHKFLFQRVRASPGMQ